MSVRSIVREMKVSKTVHNSPKILNSKVYEN